MFMNKKFSTLLMGGLLLAGTANAQVGINNLEGQKVAVGSKYFLQAGSQVSAGVYPLIQYNTKDSLITNAELGTNLNEIPLADIQAALWTLSKGTSTSTAHGTSSYYEFADENGAKLQVTLKRKGKADEVLSKWIIPSFTPDDEGILGLTLKAFAADGSAWYVAYDKTDKGFYPVSKEAEATTIYVKIGAAFDLTFDQLAEGLSVVKLNVVNAKGEDVVATGDVFEGKTLKVNQIEGSTTAYSLQDITDLTKYIGLAKDSKNNMWSIPNVTYPDGAKLVNSALKDSKGNVIAYSNFTFNYNPMTGQINVTMKYNNTDVTLAFAKLEGTTVLTVKNAATSAFETAYLEFAKGTPATLADGDGVYFIEFLDKTIKDDSGKSVYNLYATSAIEDHATSKDVIEEDELSTIKAKGQWVVKADKNGKYAIASRYNDEWLNNKKDTYVELYAVDAEKGVYTFGNCADTVRFVKADVDLTNKYMGYKHISEEDLMNKAFGLEIVNNVEGADNYAVYVKNDTLLSATATGEPFEFKLEAAEIFEGAGAKSLKDTLWIPSYMLSQQYENTYVVVKDQQLRLLSAADSDYFRFAQESADEFKILWSNDYTVVFNINDNVFTVEDDNQAIQGIDLFKFSDVRAPEYATLNAPGHLTLWSAEGDGKALSYNPTNGWAEVKLASQEPYNEDMFKLWVDTACTADAARPVYYISTTNSLDSTAIAAGQRMVLINPIDSITFTLNTKEGTATIDSKDKETYLSAEGIASMLLRSQGGVRAIGYYNVNNIKAMFVPATICGLDSLAIGTDTLTNMSINPAAMAFRTTVSGDETNDLVVESVVNKFNGYKNGYNANESSYGWFKDKNDNFIPNYVSATYFLRVVNNVLVWSTDSYEAHLFNVEKVKAPTANETIAASTVTVIAGEGNVTINGAAGKKVVIANILGQVVANTVLTSDNATIAAPAGVVVVAVEGEAAVKAIVK